MSNLAERKFIDCQQRLRALVQFCQRRDHGCFSGWPPDLIEDYLAHHAGDRTLAYVLTKTGAPVALGTAWQFRSARVTGPDWLLHPPDDWERSDPAGDAVLIDNLVADNPWALARILFRFTLRWPNWQELKLYAIRRGRAVQYDPSVLIRKLHRKAIHESQRAAS